MKFSLTRLASILFAGVVCSATALTASAQARTTAIQGMRLQAYGMGSYVRPAYDGGTRNTGYTAGGSADFTLPHVHKFELALDVRYVKSYGDVSDQSVFEGGPKAVFEFSRLHPYLDVLVGNGNIQFHRSTIPGYTHDDSKVISYGGGFDISLDRNWAIRADLQEQHWHLSDARTDTGFSPFLASVGLRYQFHFRNYHGAE